MDRGEPEGWGGGCSWLDYFRIKRISVPSWVGLRLGAEFGNFRDIIFENAPLKMTLKHIKCPIARKIRDIVFKNAP